MKITFAYLPHKKCLAISQNRFTKDIGSPDTLIYPIIPATMLTMLKRADHDVRYLDAIHDQLTETMFVLRLRFMEPDVLVYETKTPAIKSNWGTINKIKKAMPKLKVVAVGDHVSVLPKETLRNSQTDYVLVGGNYDYGMVELAKHIRNTPLLTSNTQLGRGWAVQDGVVTQTKPLTNLDDLPMIDRAIVPWEHYHESWRLHNRFFYITASRGCPYKCTFCSWPQMMYDNKVLWRTPQSVVTEIQHLIKKYGAEELFFDDDTFTCNPAWVFEFCGLMAEKGIKVPWSCNGRVDNTDRYMLLAMRRAGCRLIKYGIESASQKTLNKIRKGYTVQQVREAFRNAKEAGILRHGTVMVGWPWETLEDTQQTIRLVKELGVDTVQFSVPIVYPGTALFEEAKHKGWLRFAEGDWDNYDMSLPTLKSEHMSAETIMGLYRNAWKQVYFQPKFLAKKMMGVRRPADIGWLFKGLKAVLTTHLHKDKCE